MERQRHNARGLPEDRPNASQGGSETQSAANSPRPPSAQPAAQPGATTTQQPPSQQAPASTPNATSGSNSPNVLALQHNMTTAGTGPLPPGWGKFFFS